MADLQAGIVVDLQVEIVAGLQVGIVTATGVREHALDLIQEIDEIEDEDAVVPALRHRENELKTGPSDRAVPGHAKDRKKVAKKVIVQDPKVIGKSRLSAGQAAQAAVPDHDRIRDLKELSKSLGMS